jgi:hypothetical protein
MPTVRNTRRGPFSGAGVEFAPGANDISDDALRAVQADSVVASWFALGILVLDAPAAESAPEVAPLSAVSPVIESKPPRRRGR